jgi:hypothetical protein
VCANCVEGRPCRKIDMVCSADIHRHAHGWSMGDVRMVDASRLNEKRATHWLLAAVILNYPFLNSFLHVEAKEFENGQIHFRIHKTERVSRGGNAIESR